MKKSPPRIEVKPLEEAATPDPYNVNKHTQRGRGLLENELRKRGAFRSIASAGKGVDVPVVYAGNLTLETAASAGFKEVVNVFVEGDQLVNVVRTDIAPNSPEAVALGISDNEIGKQSYNPDIDTLAALVAGDNALLAELRKQDEVFDGMVRGMNAINPMDNPDAWEKIPADERPPFQQMSFILHDSQAERVKEALKIIKATNDFIDSKNENSNGNALSRICELFLENHGNG